MLQSVFFFLMGVYHACAIFIPQADIWGYEDDAISNRFVEIGGLDPSVADGFGDPPENALNLWRSNAVSIVPSPPNQIVTDEKLPNEQLASSAQSSPLGHDHLSDPSPANVKVDPATCNSQYRPNVPGFSNKAKRDDDFCRIGKPKCKEFWISLCCYGNPLPDEGGLTAGCVVCMRFPFLRCFNLRAITMSSFDLLPGKEKIWRTRTGKGQFLRIWMNRKVDELSFRVLSMAAM